MVGDKAIVIALNKLLKGKDTDHARIHAMYMRLIMHDKATWLPLYQAYLSKGRDISRPALDNTPDIDPFDRGGR